jgi:hypothetical protein
MVQPTGCATSIHWMAHMKKTPAAKKQKLADRINTAFDDFKSHGRITVDKAIKLGGLLVEAKAKRTQHGDWLIWLRTNCPRLVRQAPGFMRLYRHRDKFKVTAGSSISRLLSTLRCLGSIDPDAQPEIVKNTNPVFLPPPVAPAPTHHCRPGQFASR